jgi:hypothetical protein
MILIEIFNVYRRNVTIENEAFTPNLFGDVDDGDKICPWSGASVAL